MRQDIPNILEKVNQCCIIIKYPAGAVKAGKKQERKNPLQSVFSYYTIPPSGLLGIQYGGIYANWSNQEIPFIRREAKKKGSGTVLLLWGQIMPSEASSNEMQNFKSMEPVASKCPACFKAAPQGNCQPPSQELWRGGVNYLRTAQTANSREVYLPVIISVIVTLDSRQNMKLSALVDLGVTFAGPQSRKSWRLTT